MEAQVSTDTKEKEAMEVDDKGHDIGEAVSNPKVFSVRSQELSFDRNVRVNLLFPSVLEHFIFSSCSYSLPWLFVHNAVQGNGRG